MYCPFPRMDFTRIEDVIDVPAINEKRVTLVGCGGAAGLARNLVRCGVGCCYLIDPDRVGRENLCRQDYMAEEVGTWKIFALRKELKRIYPNVHIGMIRADFSSYTDDQVDRVLHGTDLFIFATDSHQAQARGNEVALRLGKPAIWIGLYPGGGAGEIVFWHPGIRSCYRCLCAARYESAAKAGPVDPPSDGVDILAVTLTDSIAAMIAVGLLTRGADNRYGKLIDQLGDRNFLQVKIDPAWRWGGRDVVREELCIPQGTDTFFSFCTIARRDPDPGGQCPDCRRFRRAEGVPSGQGGG